MNINQLHEQGFANYTELQPFIAKTVKLGTNEWGFQEKFIVLHDDSQWDFIPEDHIYEKRTSNLHYIPEIHYGY